MAATALLFFPLSTATPFSLFQNPKLFSLSSPQNPSPLVTRRAVLPIRAVQLATPSRTSVRGASVAVGGGDELLDISKLGISDQIVSALSRRGITELFPIQRAVLEPAMEGRDMIGRAITGSGKTLAFGIPILDRIIQDRSQHRKKRVPSALVLAPTRELARQVQREFKVSAPSLSSTCLYGGIPIIHQVRDLRVGMDIVVGTPGRIIDLVQRGALDLSEVKFAVLDEADQMLAVGFQEDVECILSYLPAKKQCMLFSATMPAWVNDLSRKYLRDPLVVDLVGGSDQKLADGISLYSVAAASSTKQNLLPTLISRYAQGGKSIIFTKTKKDAESLSRSMGSIIGSKALHGDMQQFQREKTLAAFRDGRFSVLVATDVAARGLDIPNVDLVIHFEMPNSTDFFVHRSGRTGRAGNKGTAVLMFTEGQRRTVRSMERELGCKFEELRGISGSAGGDKQIQYANHGSFQEFNVSESEGDFGSYGHSGRSYSRDSEPRHSRYAQTRRTQHNYDDFRNGSVNERKADRNSFQWSPRPGSPKFGTRTESNGLYRSYGNRMNHQNGSSRSYDERINSQNGSSRRYGDRVNNQNGSPRSYGDRMNNQNGSSRTYGDRMKNQKGMQKQSSSESGDYDFDHLLDLFKDLD